MPRLHPPRLHQAAEREASVPTGLTGPYDAIREWYGPPAPYRFWQDEPGSGSQVDSAIAHVPSDTMERIRANLANGRWNTYSTAILGCKGDALSHVTPVLWALLREGVAVEERAHYTWTLGQWEAGGCTLGHDFRLAATAQEELF